jgi:hypothetical protein
MFDTVLLRGLEKIRFFVNFPLFGSGLSRLGIKKRTFDVVNWLRTNLSTNYTNFHEF